MVVYFEDEDDAGEAAYRLEMRTGATVLVLKGSNGQWFLSTSDLTDQQLMDETDSLYIGAKF